MLDERSLELSYLHWIGLLFYNVAFTMHRSLVVSFHSGLGLRIPDFSSPRFFSACGRCLQPGRCLVVTTQIGCINLSRNHVGPQSDGFTGF